MGLFGKKERKAIREFSQKNIEYLNEIGKDLEEMLQELQEHYDTIKPSVEAFQEFSTSIAPKLTEEEIKKLQDFSIKIVKVKKCAKNGILALTELSRNQRKSSRESSREFNEFIES